MFRVYTEKLFWEGEQKTKESEADQPVSGRIRYFILHPKRRPIQYNGTTVLVSLV